MMSSDRLLGRVVCVCEQRDLAVWQRVSERLPDLIEAREYLLLCPDAQRSIFAEATDPRWKIVAETEFSGRWGPDRIAKNVRGMNVGRVHWLYQQFLKIRALVDTKLADDEVVLIWDADTLPLRKLHFIAESGALLCYHGREHHLPYFETVKRLFGIERQAEVSFIAQCMPVRSGRVREMVQELTASAGVSFEEAVLRVLPGASGSEFSEYETLGNWMMKRYPGELELRQPNRWLRSGSHLFGGRATGWRASVLICLLAWRYDFVAIEKWRRSIDAKRIVEFVRRKVRR